jgi:hypothetical protein
MRQKALKKIYDYNVMKFAKGEMGAVNGMAADGSIIKTNEQVQEVWTGTTFGVAALMLSEGMKDEGYRTAWGIYHTTYETQGYWFRTPEAWEIDGHYRASMYMRPAAIWAMEMTAPPKYFSWRPLRILCVLCGLRFFFTAKCAKIVLKLFDKWRINYAGKVPDESFICRIVDSLACGLFESGRCRNPSVHNHTSPGRTVHLRRMFQLPACRRSITATRCATDTRSASDRPKRACGLLEPHRLERSLLFPILQSAAEHLRTAYGKRYSLYTADDRGWQQRICWQRQQAGQESN